MTESNMGNSSGEYKGTIVFSEPGDYESLRFQPSYHENYVYMHTIAIAPSDNSDISIIMSQWYEKEKTSRFIHMFLTEEEVDLVIEGLLEAKNRKRE